jgi:hypothetical protein
MAMRQRRVAVKIFYFLNKWGYSSVGFPSESILALLPKYSENLSGDSVWMGIIVVGLSASANSFNCLTPACPLV